MKKKVLIGLAAIAALGVIGPVGSASAATHKVAIDYLVKPGSGKHASGEYSGEPFGTGKLSQTKTGPGTYTMVLKAKGGNVTLTLKGKRHGANVVGTWKALSGTGKFKGIKGKGPWIGGAGGVYDVDGKVTY